MTPARSPLVVAPTPSLPLPLALPPPSAQVVARSADEAAEDTKHATKRGVRGALEGVKDAVYGAGSALRSGESERCLGVEGSGGEGFAHDGRLAHEHAVFARAGVVVEAAGVDVLVRMDVVGTHIPG